MAPKSNTESCVGIKLPETLNVPDIIALPVTVSKDPSNVRFSCAFAPNDVPSDVKTLLGDGFVTTIPGPVGP